MNFSVAQIHLGFLVLSIGMIQYILPDRQYTLHNLNEYTKCSRSIEYQIKDIQ